MPRIDPIQLLECLSVLLAPNGGIKSADKVMRLASLMTKFSKKLVSKCIYIQILKCTETELLGTFMGSGGWKLVYMWLTESIVSKNWPLVAELLELLLLCPIDIERLKTNNCPKLVKELSKDGNHIGIRALASKLVEQWLKTVKGENVIPLQITDIPKIIAEAEASGIFLDTSAEISHNKSDITVTEKENVENIKPEEPIEEKEAIPKLKIKINESKSTSSDSEKTKKSKEKSRGDEKSSSTKSSSSKHSSKSRESSSSDKHRSSSSSHKSSSSHSSSSSKDKSRSSSHSSSKSSKNHESKHKSDSSSSSKSSKEHKKEDKSKDEKNGKDDLSIDKNSKKEDRPSIQKLGKIPKLKDTGKDKPSMSIEVRKPDEPKPKTVKTFNSKFRSHGLEEEVKPPPSRASLLSKKPPPPLIPPTVVIPKRPSLTLNDTPPEKKIKTVEHVEKPGAIKLIAPKPKPMLLLESDMFMDALNASATNKKEPKKRKRRTSGSKDGNPANDTSPPNTPTTASSSPSSDIKSKSVPPRFYQDTLESEDDKDKSFDKDSDTVENIDANESLVKSPTINSPDIEESKAPQTLTVNGLKGVLCYNRRKGPKKSIRWKPDCDLEEIQYFELDETERVNVTKTFTDMKHLERIHEREAFQKARNLINDDVMEERTPWRPLILIDTENQVLVEYGKKSSEKEIQAARQKGTLPPLYFHKSMIPDSPLEAEQEPHPYSEPAVIPLEDVTGNQDNVSDFRNVPWPEPKGNAPANSSAMGMPSLFQPNMVPFPNNFGGPPLAGFQGNMIPPADWQGAVMMQNGIAPGNVLPGPIPPGAMPPMGMPPVAMPPGLMMNPETMLMNPEMFGPNPMFPGPPEGFNMMEQMNPNGNMFPPDFNMGGMQGPPNSGNYRGNNRGRGNHWRGKNSNNWDGPARGRGGGHNRGGRKSVCIYFQRKGSCRQGDNCTFLHPGVNCPY